MLRFAAWTLLCCTAAAACGTPGKALDGEDQLAVPACQWQVTMAQEKAVEELASAVIADPEAFKAVLAFRRAAAALSDVGEGKLGVVFKAKKDAVRIQKAEEALRKFDEAVKPNRPELDAVNDPEFVAAVK